MTLTRGSKGLVHIERQEHRDSPHKLGLWYSGSSSLILSLSQCLVTLGDGGMGDSVLWPLSARLRMLHVVEPLFN